MELDNNGDGSPPSQLGSSPKKRLHSSTDSGDKENEASSACPLIDRDQSDLLPASKKKRIQSQKSTPAKPKDSESLLSSITGTLSEDLRLQLTNSDSIIQTLAVKMAEEMAAQKLRELSTNDEESASFNEKKKEAKEKARLDREAAALRKEEEKQRKEEERNRKEKERLEKKEQERLRKEAEKLKREEEKSKRDEEKAKREEERLVKREEERLKKEEERRKKEEDKRLKDEEKKKQTEVIERKQSRIANFFAVKKASPVKGSPPAVEVSDYDSTFLPFYLRANIHLCKQTAFLRTPEELQAIEKNLDSFLLQGNEPQTPNSSLNDWLASKRVNRGFTLEHTAKDAVVASSSETSSEANLVSILVSLPQKFIRFADNVRPPYIGTFSKSREGGIPRNNPFFKTGTGLNYDYDSEIEWAQEDEDGEDLDLDDDSDENEEEDDDMDEFLSSDEAPIARRLIVGPLTPSAHWNDGITNQEVFKAMEMDVLAFENDTISIDPFYDYWSPPPKAKQLAKGEDLRPLALTNDKKKKKLLATTDMKAFVHKIQGTEMNQIMLVEILKKE